MNSETIATIIVLLAIVGSSMYDGYKIDRLEDNLKIEIHKNATIKAELEKERIFNESINRINEEHINEVNDLNNTPVGGVIYH